MKSLRDQFLEKFCMLCNSVPSKNGVRLQKSSYVRKYAGQTFTVTIQRGDMLNKRSRK